MIFPFDLLSNRQSIFDTSNKGLLLRRLTHSSLKLLLPYIKSNNPKKKGAMVLYAAGDFGSLGDQAMFLSASEGLKNNGYHEISLLSPAKPSKTELPEFASNLANPNDYFNGSTIESAKFQKRFASNDGFFIIGADVMDGYYSAKNSLRKIHLLQLATSLGLPTKVFGFSFNDNPDEEVVAALQALPAKVELLARDPISQRRLETTLNRPIRLVADLAFLLQPDPLSDAASTTLHWIQKQKEKGAKVIGINANALLARDIYHDPLPIATGLAQTIIELNKTHPELRFVMIAHDFRGNYNDVMLNRLTAEIVRFTNPTFNDMIFTMPTPCTAAEIKAVCGEIDFAITGRMHFAIACLGQSTPALCIGYQGKMEGLFEHFNLKNMVITPKEAFASNKLITRASMLLENEQELRQKINATLPKVLSLAKMNFE